MKRIMLLAGVAALSLIPLAARAASADGPEALLRDSKPYADLRYRYEHVDQTGFGKDANASTIRAAVGLKTGSWQDFQGLVEVEAVGHLGPEHFNDGVNGQTSYPKVVDPEGIELNQLWLSWAGLPQSAVKVGRQIIALDNQRFIGPGAWRQNDQTMDAVTFSNNSIKDLSLMYGYIWNVNRSSGEKNSAEGNYYMQTHLLHGDYALLPWLKATGYAYLMNNDRVKTLSSQTYGLRLSGERDLMPDAKFSYVLEGARQSDYDNSTLNYHENYYHVQPGVTWRGWTAQAGYEVLGGNGTAAFQTPLASLHPFNGWADKFLTVPANGLQDTYGRLAYKVSGVQEWVDGTVLEAIYHNFDADKGSANYGDEWDMQISKTFKSPADGMLPFAREWSLALQYADFNGDNATVYKDTSKLFLILGAKF